MCTLCALMLLFNFRAPQSVAAESVPEETSAPAQSAAEVSAAYRRLCAARPEIDPGDWPYALCGAGRPVTGAEPETVRVGGVPVDARIADELRAMIAQARSAGLRVYLSCGYTDAAAQTHIYRRTAAKYGETTAQTIVGLPNESEHRSGLAVDIAVAGAALLGIRLRAALSQGQKDRDRTRLRALALPLCREGGRSLHDFERTDAGGVSGSLPHGVISLFFEICPGKKQAVKRSFHSLFLLKTSN